MELRAGVWSDQKKNWWVLVVEPNSVGGGVEASQATMAKVELATKVTEDEWRQRN